MTRRSAVLAVSWLAASTSAGGYFPQTQGAPVGAPIALQETLERIRIRHALPGLAAAVVHGGSTTSRAVVGVRRQGGTDSLRLDDRFHIASCTKSMTATLAAVLIQSGLLQWDSRLVTVVPELGDRIRPEYRTATLEQLLAHAAHTPAYTQFGRERMAELVSLPGSRTAQRTRFLAEVLASEPPNPESGEAGYSNVGYTAAAVMLERATGTSWEELIRTRLAQPLGLDNLGFGWPATVETPDQPRGHVRRNGQVVEQRLDDDYQLPVALSPAGAVHSSISDLARYAADHLNGLRGRPALLPGDVYQRLHRTLTGAPQGFTLGWGVRQDARFGTIHFGAGSGGTFFVRIVIVPAMDVAIVVASNSGEAGPATREVVDSLLTGAATAAKLR